MPAKTPAQQKAQKKYMSSKATIQIVLSSDEKTLIEAAADMLSKNAGKKISVAEFVKDSIRQRIERENLLPAPADPPQD